MAAGKSGSVSKQDIEKVFSTAKKRPMNFALLVGKDGLVLEADLRKAPGALRTAAKKQGGSRGAAGVMKVNGKVVELHVDEDDPQKNLPELANKFYRSLGLSYRFEFRFSETPEAPAEAAEETDEPKPRAEPETAAAEETPDAAPAAEAEAEAEGAEDGAEAAGPEAGGGLAELRRTFKTLDAPLKEVLKSGSEEQRQEIGKLAKAFLAQSKAGDEQLAAETLAALQQALFAQSSTDDGEAEDGDEDDTDEEDLQDLTRLMSALKKKPYNFAWMIGKEGLVLKAHRRRPTSSLIKKAKADGGGARGAWGVMERDGKSLILTCEEDPPAMLARLGRLQLRDKGFKVKVVIRGPSGEVTEGEEEAEAGTEAKPAVDPRKLETLRTMHADALAAGDTAKAAKIVTMLDRLDPEAAAQLASSGEDAQVGSEAEEEQPDAVAPGAETGEAPPEGAAPQTGRLEKRASAQPGSDASAPEGENAEVEAEDPPKKLAIPKKVPVDRTMTNLEFSNHVDIVVKGMTPAEAKAENADPENRVQPLDFEVTEEHVKQKYVIVNFIIGDQTQASGEEMAQADASFAELPKDQKQAVNAHVDEMFWEMTGYNPGEKLDPKDPNFEVMAEAWKQLRANVMADAEKVQAIPDRLRKFLKFKENGVKVTPKDFRRLLELADKLQHLSDAELADYWNRTTARTEDVDAFADSVERYIEQIREHQEATSERSDAQDKLVGMEKLYETYLRSQTPHMQTHDEFGVVDQNAIRINAETDAAKKALPGLLDKHDYDDVAEFKADIERYKSAFQREAVSLANEAMDHRAHELYEFETEVLTDDSLSGMMQALDGIREKRDEMAGNILYKTGSNYGPGPTDWPRIRKELRPMIEAAIAKDEGLKKLIQLRKDEDPKFTLDDEMIDLLSEAEDAADLKARIKALLEARHDGIADTRATLEDDPEKIWNLDIAVAHTRAEGMVSENSIQDMILDKHQSDLAKWDFLKNLGLGALAIAAGLVSGGSGTVAVLGAAAAVGIGAYEGWEAYRTYAEGKDAHLAGLSSVDPSFAWVVLALATVPLDALGVGQAVKATKLARGAKIAEMLAQGSDVGTAVRAFNKAQDTLEEGTDTVAIIRKLEDDLAKADERVRKAIVRYAKAELEANEAFAKAMKSGGKMYAAIDPVVTPIAIMASRFAYPVFLWMRKGVIGLEQFLATRHAVALVGKLDELKRLDGALPNIKKAYKLAKDEAEEVAKAARALDMTDLDIDSVAAYWAKNPELSGDDVIRKLPLFKQARDNLGPLEDLAAGGSDAARRAYRQQLVDAERIANQCQRFGLSDLDIEVALEFRGRHPDMDLDEFIDHIPSFRSDPDAPMPISGGAGSVQRETGVVSSGGTVHNAPGATGKNATVKAPRSVMDEETEELLKGLGPDNLDHGIAGTGGIEKIKVTRHPTEPDILNYEIEGEILPGRLQRDPKKPLKPGQSYAPNFNSAGDSVQDAIKKLGFENPDDWQRLHLWGPGFGDEAAAGMLLGPREINLEWQNSGIEDLIRELGRQVAPHRGAGFKLKVKASAQSWGRPTPKGFQTANGEPLFKEASYEILLETPTGTKTARVDITSQTDPFDINLGKDPGVHVGFSEAALNDLFGALPD